MLALWIIIIIVAVLIGAIPIILFLGHMHELDDFIQSTYQDLPPEKRAAYKNIQKALRSVFLIGVLLYIATASLLCVISVMKLVA